MEKLFMNGVKLLFSSVFILMLILTNVHAMGVLTIDKYMDMVLENNSELKSIQLKIDALEGKLAETEKIYFYYLSTGVNYSEDYKKEFYSNNDESNKNVKYDTKIDKQFATGTKITLSLNNLYNRNTNYNIRPSIELEQSLLKNMGGVHTKAEIEKVRASTKSTLYKLEYDKQNILLNARLAYWNLAYSRMIINFKKLSLNRTEKILTWSQKKYDMDLILKSNLLEVQAALKKKELNLCFAYEEEKKMNRQFNQFLNVNNIDSEYKIENFETKSNNFKIDKTLNKKGTRKDVLSVLESVSIALYDQISTEKNLKSDLIFKGQYMLVGAGQTINDVMKDIENSNKFFYSLELRYILPLNFKLQKKINQGYKFIKIAAQKSAEYALIQENNDWFQLMYDWSNIKKKLNTVIEIENIQRQKYEEDKNLFIKGRITTTQILREEQALDDAKLDVSKNIFELIKIYEQAEIIYNN
jgi:outer membrane protein TolC